MDDTKKEESVVPPKQSSDLKADPEALPPKAHTFRSKIQQSEIKSQRKPILEPEHIGIMSEEQAEKEILDAPAEEESLIDLIAASDEKEEKKEKKQKLDLHFDVQEFLLYRDKIIGFFEKYSESKKILDVLWMFFMASIFVGGIAFFAVFAFLYFSFTPLLKNYLIAKDLSTVDFTVADYSLSELKLTDVHDKQGLFTINTIRLQYDFINLLKGRISLADIDTLNIYIKGDKGTGYNTQDVLSLFQKLGLMDTGSPIQIQTLQFKNSKIYINNDEYQMPVDFSGLGDLEKRKQFVIPFNFKNDYLTANASLTTSLENGGVNWSISLDKGKLFIPDLPDQNIKGTVVAKTRGNKLASISIDLTLGEEQKASVQITPAEDGFVSIDVEATLPPVLAGARPMNLKVTMPKATIAKDLKSLVSDGPMTVKFSEFKTNIVQTDLIQATLDGHMACTPLQCSFKLKKAADVLVFSLLKKAMNMSLKSTQPVRLSLQPTAEDLFTLSSTQLSVNAFIKKLEMVLDENQAQEETTQLKVASAETTVKAQYDFVNDVGSVTTDSKGVSLADKVVQVEKADIKTNTDKKGTLLSLSSPQVLLPHNDSFKLPFSLDLSMDEDNYFTAVVTDLNKQIRMNATGYVILQTGEWQVSVDTQPIVFDKTLQPAQITNILDERIKNVSGAVALKGILHWKSTRDVTGPMYVSLDKVSFSYGDVQIKNISTVAEITSFVPFGTQRNQEAFIESLTTLLPFQNVVLNYFFDSEKGQTSISKMNMNVAGVTLRMDPSWLSYQSPSHTLQFKAKAVKLSNVEPYLTLTDLKMRGTASINMTLQLDSERLSLKTLEVSIPTAGSISYTQAAGKGGTSGTKFVPFKKATILLSELMNGTTDFLLLGDKLNSQDTRKNTIRLNISKPLRDYIKSMPIAPVPPQISELIQNF